MLKELAEYCENTHESEQEIYSAWKASASALRPANCLMSPVLQSVVLFQCYRDRLVSKFPE